MSEKIYKIYKATNKITNKIYIGVTRRPLHKRIADHIRQSKKPIYKFHRAINKYGVDSFLFEIISENLLSEEAMLKEIECIKLYDSYNNGYNSTIGGECPSQSRGRNFWTKESAESFLVSRKKWLESAEGIQFRQRASERFKKLKPEQFASAESKAKAVEKYKDWIYNTEAGTKRRRESAENMRVIQKLRHNGIYKLQDPTGYIHIIEGDIMIFCKQHNLSFHSFYYALTHNSCNVRGPNAGWKIIQWNHKLNS